jgi:hypothetical protein
VEIFHFTVPKLLRRKIYHFLILMPVFIVQVTKLAQFNMFSKIPPSTWMHFAAMVKIWRLACMCGDVALPRKPFGKGHMYG